MDSVYKLNIYNKQTSEETRQVNGQGCHSAKVMRNTVDRQTL